MNLSNYVGIPFEDGKSSFDGADCFGLVRLYYKYELGINVPCPKASAYDSKATFLEFAHEISTNWVECVSEPNCVVGISHDMRYVKTVQHFGIILPDGRLLHSLDGIGSHIVDIGRYSNLIRGYYKWRN